jgi:hypothetical protein
VWDRPCSGDHQGAISEDGRFVARGLGYREDNHGPYVDTAVEVIEAATGEIVSVGRHRSPVASLAFAPGNLLAGDDEGELRFWAI